MTMTDPVADLDDDPRVVEMARLIATGDIDRNTDASHVWDLCGEKVGDEDLVCRICAAYHNGRHDEAAGLGARIAELVFESAAELIEDKT
ncbi:hypothetical protein [Halomonas sp. BN3-1]|uniref:hypothetical protein n=1 Tax=Halomonas sp. BN3-1 TaxID=2082393 RepID=UPI0013B455CA|nr:hypothetical protein [Halomonas sp. BN3-1]